MPHSELGIRNHWVTEFDKKKREKITSRENDALYPAPDRRIYTNGKYRWNTNEDESNAENYGRQPNNYTYCNIAFQGIYQSYNVAKTNNIGVADLNENGFRFVMDYLYGKTTKNLFDRDKSYYGFTLYNIQNIKTSGYLMKFTEDISFRVYAKKNETSFIYLYIRMGDIFDKFIIALIV